MPKFKFEFVMDGIDEDEAELIMNAIKIWSTAYSATVEDEIYQQIEEEKGDKNEPK